MTQSEDPQTPPSLSRDTQHCVLEVTGATAIAGIEQVQTLWSGYGSIQRLHLTGSQYRSVVLKQVQPPQLVQHPRGWATQRSDQRKRRSYVVEATWYQNFARNLPTACRVAQALHVESTPNDGWLLVLQDLATEYPLTPHTMTQDQVIACLRWLAALHAHGLGLKPQGLWPSGCYWHLDTRPDELATMPDSALKRAAPHLDKCLSDSRFQTIVHGDAKQANFCFSEQAVAAVDFQYVGGGPGIRDLAYFLGSALDDQALEHQAAELTDSYFTLLREHLSPRVNADALEAEWRELLPIAWTDFTRFLMGWAPEHAKINEFTHRMTDLALARLTRG